MSSSTADHLLDEVRDAAEVDDQTSARILDAALDRFTTFGVRRTTMDDIASAAGIGRATVYRRFAGRDEIVRAVILREMARFIGEVDAAVQAIDDPLERFVEEFVATLREAREHPLLRRLLEVEPDCCCPSSPSRAPRPCPCPGPTCPRSSDGAGPSGTSAPTSTSTSWRRCSCACASRCSSLRTG